MPESHSTDAVLANELVAEFLAMGGSGDPGSGPGPAMHQRWQTPSGCAWGCKCCWCCFSLFCPPLWMYMGKSILLLESLLGLCSNCSLKYSSHCVSPHCLQWLQLTQYPKQRECFSVLLTNSKILFRIRSRLKTS